MRSNSMNPNNAAHDPGRGGGGSYASYAGQGIDDEGDFRDELHELEEHFEGLSGKGFEDRYRDPVFVDRYLRFLEARSRRWPGIGLPTPSEHLLPREALRRLVKDGDSGSRRPTLISDLIRNCPDLKSRDLALPRFQEWLGFGWEKRTEPLHVDYLQRIAGHPWELPRPSGVLFLPEPVRVAMAALDSVSNPAELSQEHAETLISMLTHPERCGDWKDPTVSAARCPHCGGQDLTPMSEENRNEGRLNLLRFAHRSDPVFVSQSRYRICIDCGYMLPFIGEGSHGLANLRRAFRKPNED